MSFYLQTLIQIQIRSYTLIVKSILHKKISDLYITLFFLIIGAAFWTYVFTQDMQMHNRTFYESFEEFMGFPILLGLFFIWFRTIVLDVIRIYRKQDVRMPGTLFIIAGMQIFFFYLLIDSTGIYRAAYFNTILNIWVFADIIVLSIAEAVLPESFFEKKVSDTEFASTFESKYYFEYSVSALIFSAFWFISMLIGLSSNY